MTGQSAVKLPEKFKYRITTRLQVVDTGEILSDTTCYVSNEPEDHESMMSGLAEGATKAAYVLGALKNAARSKP